MRKQEKSGAKINEAKITEGASKREREGEIDRYRLIDRDKRRDRDSKRREKTWIDR